MDLAVYARVARRFWPILVMGILLAVFLAAFSMFRISAHGVSYRRHEVWQTQSTLLLTQKGFPYGRAVIPSDSGASQLSGGLSELYSQFANSDAVRIAMKHQGAPKSWVLDATSDSTDSSLPIVDLFATAYTSKSALQALRLGTRDFLAYVSSLQKAAAIPASQRVQIQILQAAAPPVVIQPRKKTLPIVVFLAVLMLTIGLVFALENVRPRHSSVMIPMEPSAPDALSRVPRIR